MKNLNEIVSNKKLKIIDWLNAKAHKLPVYSSVDIRNSGFKIAHVDTNLFPSGFNNLSEQGEKRAANLFKRYMIEKFPHFSKVLLIPENFTRNTKYLENVASFIKIVQAAGFEVKVGTIFEHGINEIDGHDYFKVEALKKVGKKIATAAGWKPDIIILNNDLTTGLPEILDDCSQPIVPDKRFGWYKRRKSGHFNAFDKIVGEFAKEFKVDPWLLSTIHGSCAAVDFRHKSGLEALAKVAEKVLNLTKEKYAEYNIQEEPYVFIKADQGTYGMGIMAVKHPEEIIKINKKHRHSMNTIKQGVHNSEVLVQEGVPTIERYKGFPAESLAYMVYGEVAEMLVRYNKMHNELVSLNSKGMELINNQIDAFDIKHIIAALAVISTSEEKI